MRQALSKPLRFLLPALVLAGLSLAPASASASDCIRRYAECLVIASDLDTWWQRTAAGIDCWVDAVACIRGIFF